MWWRRHSANPSPDRQRFAVPGTPHIVIVGGGFAGATVALHLLKAEQPTAFTLTVVEPRAVIGAGLAYSAEDPAHRINVAAARMTPLPDDLEHFDRWFRQSPEAAADPAAIIADGRAYPRRQVFGRYVDALVRAHAAQVPHIRFQHLRSQATTIAPNGEGYRVTLADGPGLDADLVILATGHNRPGIPGAFAEVANHPRFIANPWEKHALKPIRAADWVLLIGTGLTMADTVASLRAWGHGGQITAISRRGQLPQPRTSLPVQAFGDFSADPAVSVSVLLHRVRKVARDLQHQGRPWEDVIDAIRQQGFTIWNSLSLVEKQRFLRHLRPYWDSHRYQIAPQVDDVLRDEIRRRGLQVIAGNFTRVTFEQEVFRVKLHPRGAKASALQERHFHAVVNCTGPDHAAQISGNPPLLSLQEQGLLVPDPLKLGVHVDRDSQVLDAAGRSQPGLLFAGPAARYTFGELMGLPQVTLQAKAVADQAGRWLAKRVDHAAGHRLAAYA
ncbi:MAG TPA: FAD/NAD(P)-binding protein [Dongiaceae bacterium]|nr:FAD/NAD(P)-binding protein [Dongiaceae bacterium]